MKKSKKLLLIDGSSMLVTAYYGCIPPAYRYAKTEAAKQEAYKSFMQTSSGVYTNGVYTMMKQLLSLIAEQKPTHLVVAWDISRDTFRRKIYSDYKAHRSASPQPLLQQFATAQKVLAAMGISQLQDVKYEADDFLGSCAKKFEQEIPTYLLTKDHDYLQLVSDHTRLWLICNKAKDYQKDYYDGEINFPGNSIELTPQHVKDIFGIYPSQVPDWKGISGDPSDNIPGVKGVSDKTAIPLLQEYGTIETIYDVIRLEDEKGKKELMKFWKEDLGINRSPINNLLKESLKDDKGEVVQLLGEDAAKISKTLATIKTDVPIEFILEDLELNIDKENMNVVFTELEFSSLISK